MKKGLLSLVCLLFLTSCLGLGKPPAATSTPTQEQIFTSKILLSTKDGKSFSAYSKSASLRFVKNEKTNKVEDVFEYLEPACYPSGEVCSTNQVNELIQGNYLVSFESGCWQATRQGDDYTEPQPCQQ